MNKVSRRSMLMDSAKMVGGLVMVTAIGKAWAQSPESEPHVGKKTEEQKLPPKGKHNAGYYDNGTSPNMRDAQHDRQKAKAAKDKAKDDAAKGADDDKNQ